jgi:glycosyltransferase involved in cell wall biosynthesis
LMSLSYRLIARARRRGLPCLLTLHDYWFICSNSQLIWPDARVCQGKGLGLNCVRCATARIGKPWMKAARVLIAPIFQLRDALVRRAALGADLLIAPSRFLIDQYVAAGFPAGRFKWLENGIDAECIQAFARQPPGGDRVHVTYLGSLAWQKGVHILVQAAHALSSERVCVRLFGSLGTFPDYVDFLRELANPAHTTFEGMLPHDLIGRALAETDVLVVPSLWYENSPVTIQEAFAAGVPVMASRLGALSEKVCHEVNGLLVPPGDVEAWRRMLERLVNEPGLLERLRRGVPPVMAIQEHVQQLEPVYRWARDQQGDFA